MKNTKIDFSKLREISKDYQEDGYKPLYPKPSKRVKKKGVKSNLQKKKDNPNSSYWKKKAMAAWGILMHAKYDTCLVGRDCKGNLEAHHLISRSKVLTRNDINNGVLLCSLHHKFSNELSPHTAPVQFTEFLRENYPEKIEYVRENTHRTGKPNYQADCEHLTKLLEDL